jgi:mannan endo-1,4-beta-mannosidase
MEQPMKLSLLFVIVLIVPAISLAQTADPNASADGMKLYAWFQQLNSQPKTKLVVGEQMQMMSVFGNWQQSITDIAAADGNIPVAMMGISYSHSACPGGAGCQGTLGVDYVAPNAGAKYYWSQNGASHRLVYAFGFFPNPIDLSSWAGKLPINDTNMTLAITDNGNTYNTNWKRILDQYAAGFQELQNSGIVVIFQPFNEADGSWMWYYSMSDIVFVNVWRYVFNYFTTTKGLHNLLWHYAQASDSRPGQYPGDAYVDFVGIDPFNCGNSDCGTFPGYASLTTAHPTKPFGIAGYGPACANGINDPGVAHNCYDYSNLVSTIHNSNPKTVFINIWWASYALQNHLGSHTFMSDSWVINGNNLNWSGSPPTSKPQPPSGLAAIVQ